MLGFYMGDWPEDSVVRKGVLTVSAIIRSTSGGRDIKLGLLVTSGFKSSLAVKGNVASERAIAQSEVMYDGHKLRVHATANPEFHSTNKHISLL